MNSQKDKTEGENSEWVSIEAQDTSEVNSWVVTSGQQLTRFYLACGTMVFYFILLLVPVIYLFLGVIDVANTIDLLKTIAAILGGIVGMVWGFYFTRTD